MILREEKWGGNKTYTAYEALEKDFAEQVGARKDSTLSLSLRLLRALWEGSEQPWEMEIHTGGKCGAEHGPVAVAWQGAPSQENPKVRGWVKDVGAPSVPVQDRTTSATSWNTAAV